MLSELPFLEQYLATRRFRAGRPAQVTFAPDGRSVLFLRSPPREAIQDLFEFDLGTRTEKQLLNAHSLTDKCGEILSGLEQARRERARSSARGITSFELTPDSKRILATMGHRLLFIDRHSGRFHDRVDESRAALAGGLSPDGKKLAFVADSNLSVQEIESGREFRLTTTGSPTLSNGLADFIAQEEMHRMEGYWWSPDSALLAYQETNATGVETRYIADSFDMTRGPAAHRYPRAGTENARVRLGLVSVQGGPTTWVSWDQEAFPYLATVKWSRDGPLLVVVQNREQTELTLLEVDLETGKTRALLKETDPAWLNLDQDFPWFVDKEIGFLWMTERNGGRQLELRKADGASAMVLTRPEHRFRKLLDVDLSTRVAWVLASPDPTCARLAAVSLDPPHEFNLVEESIPRADHSETVFAHTQSLAVQCISSDDSPSRWLVRTREKSNLGPILAELSCTAEKPRANLHREFVEIESDTALPASVVRPESFVRGRKYPVIVFVYGGPGSQVVKVGRPSWPFDQWLANQGFIVVSADGRGTPAHTRNGERAIKGDFATLPLADQVTALQELGRIVPELDLGRVGIFGWSFGGYLAAMAVMRRPDIFHAAVCGAPVVDFREYDTHYTERYLGLPEANQSAYEVSSLHTYANELRRPLLLIHGTADDNCYFGGSLRLSDTLLRAGIAHEFLPLAGQTHMVSDADIGRRIAERTAEFFQHWAHMD